ncbi:hydrogen peroxide-inducible genes activator [Microvirga guangxiensis]|uniref:LysR family transcriptional regulator, hydrogen peroxide-inducible genes activator n=1 Tax=Microvirga guangxiensis TaxID=549386 RepID=A0A1G5GR52_9HYPH|nr:hydrogen peroxide-inducible genes activator [Microvirga guangxiensis]SCY53138.1 LysR family transcriptional regulator, hydrogen peroxide-inducible genes activator [Microvirga guangxiensis]
MVTIRQLRYFSSLARTHHFGMAADQCAVTQPALSMQIKELERELGVELVERRGNSVVLTLAGQEIAKRAEAILGQVRELTDLARQHHGVLAGPIRLGIIPSVAPYLLPAMLTEVQRHYPQLDLQIRETQTDMLLDELLRGDLDAVLVALPVQNAQLESEPLFDDRFLVAVQAPAADQWASKDLFEWIGQERLLLLEEGHCLRDQALHYCQIANMQARKSLGAASLTTIMQMVAAGHGITLLPELCAEAEVDRQRVALIPFPDNPPKRTLGLVWRKTSGRKKDFSALAELIKSVRQVQAA